MTGTRPAHAAILLFLISVAVCIAFTAAFPLPPVECYASEYLSLAQNVAAGEGFIRDGEPSSYRTAPQYAVVAGDRSGSHRFHVAPLLVVLGGARNPDRRSALWTRRVSDPCRFDILPIGTVRFSFFTTIRANRLSLLTRYADRLVQYQPLEHDTGDILKLAQAPQKSVARNMEELREAFRSDGTAQPRVDVFLNGNLNYSFDIQSILKELHSVLNRRSRVLVLAYNPYSAWLHRLARRFGARRAEVPWTFITQPDLANVARLSSFEVVRMRPAGVIPVSLLGMGAAVNRLLEALPGVRRLAFSMLLVLRPLDKAKGRPSLSIVIPARDERDNIEAALTRLPDFQTEVEVIFVEGHSRDGTWQEIQNVANRQWKNLKVRAFQQTGKGKADAVREGFSHCRNEVKATAKHALSGSNGALAWIIFQRDRSQFERQFPGLRLLAYEPFSPLQYWLSGALKSWSLVPAPLIGLLQSFESALLRLSPQFGSFTHIVLRRR